MLLLLFSVDFLPLCYLLLYQFHASCYKQGIYTCFLLLVEWWAFYL